MLIEIDVWLLGKLEKFSHWFQKLTGKNCFWLAKMAAVLAAQQVLVGAGDAVAEGFGERDLAVLLGGWPEPLGPLVGLAEAGLAEGGEPFRHEPLDHWRRPLFKSSHLKERDYTADAPPKAMLNPPVRITSNGGRPKNALSSTRP